MSTITDSELQGILTKLHEKFVHTTRDKPRNFSNMPVKGMKLQSFKKIKCKIAGCDFKLRSVDFLKITYLNEKSELLTLNVPAHEYSSI